MIRGQSSSMAPAVVAVFVISLFVESFSAPNGCIRCVTSDTTGGYQTQSGWVNSNNLSQRSANLEDLIQQVEGELGGPHNQLAFDNTRPGNWRDVKQYRTADGHGRVYEEQGQQVQGPVQVRYYKKNFTSSYSSGNPGGFEVPSLSGFDFDNIRYGSQSANQGSFGQEQNSAYDQSAIRENSYASQGSLHSANQFSSQDERLGSQQQRVTSSQFGENTSGFNSWSTQQGLSEQESLRPGNWTTANTYKTDGGNGRVYEERGQVVTGPQKIRFYRKNYTSTYSSDGGIPNLISGTDGATTFEREVQQLQRQIDSMGREVHQAGQHFSNSDYVQQTSRNYGQSSPTVDRTNFRHVSTTGNYGSQNYDNLGLDSQQIRHGAYDSESQRVYQTGSSINRQIESGNQRGQTYGHMTGSYDNTNGHGAGGVQKPIYPELNTRQTQRHYLSQSEQEEYIRNHGSQSWNQDQVSTGNLNREQQIHHSSSHNAGTGPGRIQHYDQFQTTSSSSSQYPNIDRRYLQADSNRETQQTHGVSQDKTVGNNYHRNYRIQSGRLSTQGIDLGRLAHGPDCVDTASGHTTYEHSQYHTQYRRNTEDFDQQTQHINQHTEDLTQQTEDLTQQIEDLTQQTEDLTQQTQDLTQQTEDLTQQTQDLTQQTEDFGQQSQGIIEQSGDLTQQTQDLTQQTEDLTQQTQDLTQQTEDFGQQSQGIIEQSGDLTQQTQDLTQQTEDFSQQSQGVIEQSGDLTQQTQDLTQQTEDLTQQTQDLTQQTEDFGQQSQGVIEQSGDLTQQTEDLAQQTQDLTQQTEDLTQQTQDFTQQTEDFTQQSQDFTQQTEELPQQTQGYIQQSQDLTQQIEDLPQQTEGFIAESGNLGQQVEDLTQQTVDVTQSLQQESGHSIDVGEPNYVPHVSNFKDVHELFFDDEKEDNRHQEIEKISPQEEDLTQQTQDLNQETEDLTQQTQDLTQQTEDFNQQSQGLTQDTEDLSQQITGGNSDFGQQTNWGLDRFQVGDQQVEDLNQRTQGLTQETEDLSQQITGGNSDFGQQTNWGLNHFQVGDQQAEDLNQRTQGLTQETEDLSQQITGGNSDFGQQTNWGLDHFQVGDQQAEDLNQRTQGLTQETEDLSQQITGGHSDFGQQTNWGLDHFQVGDQQAEDLNQRTQGLTQETEDLSQQITGGNSDFGQQTNWGLDHFQVGDQQAEDLNQRTQGLTQETEDLSQQISGGNSDFGQQTNWGLDRFQVGGQQSEDLNQQVTSNSGIYNGNLNQFRQDQVLDYPAQVGIQPAPKPKPKRPKHRTMHIQEFSTEQEQPSMANIQNGAPEIIVTSPSNRGDQPSHETISNTELYGSEQSHRVQPTKTGGRRRNRYYGIQHKPQVNQGEHGQDSQVEHVPNEVTTSQEPTLRYTHVSQLDKQNSGDSNVNPKNVQPIPEIENRFIEAYGANGPYNSDHEPDLFNTVKPNPSAILPPVDGDKEPFEIIWSTTSTEPTTTSTEPTTMTTEVSIPTTTEPPISTSTTVPPPTTTAAPSLWRRFRNRVSNTIDKARERAISIFG
ncbi:uncharacterized protein LOC124309633 isoform X8 [Neodiprion virginianus]|uniref:uncharacterized protein LOC124309633 isoform X8 n=1 Tax=Neodiprion virginianus TaxID=2961670 RepID=UPI001EE6F483|nr:uncharacterized protein LOC124309633 isoform X8 [Neodiprion virginianus]